MEYCNEVLQCSPGNIKAYHRKGVALYHLANYEESMSSLQNADQTGNHFKYLVVSAMPQWEGPVKLMILYIFSQKS